IAALATNGSVRGHVAGIEGMVGAVAFAMLLGLLAISAIRLVNGIRADRGDRLLIGTAAGLAAFVATMWTMRPPVLSTIPYPFWIVLGAAIARADGDADVTLPS